MQAPVQHAENWLRARFDAAGAVVRAASEGLAGASDPPRLACARCRSDWPTHTLACPACGGTLEPLVPMAVLCGFCGSANRRDVTAECRSCGGPLPSLPGGSPGAQPPDPPRRLPLVASDATLAFRGVSRFLGLMCILFGVALAVAGIGLVLIALGVWLLYGWKLREHGKRAALTHGHATRGRIVRVRSEDLHSHTAQGTTTSTRYTIDYEYDADTRRRGRCIGADAIHALRRAGDEVWVVYVPKQAWLRNALWPPVL